MKTAGKAMGNHPGKYVIRETEYAATAWPLTWSITPRHDVLKS